MRKSRFIEAQIIGMIKEQEAGPADLSVSIQRRSGVNARRIILIYARR